MRLFSQSSRSPNFTPSDVLVQPVRQTNQLTPILSQTDLVLAIRSYFFNIIIIIILIIILI
jgi:hypothetical protein